MFVYIAHSCYTLIRIHLKLHCQTDPFNCRHGAKRNRPNVATIDGIICFKLY